jgi:hypothetical protein
MTPERRTACDHGLVDEVLPLNCRVLLDAAELKDSRAAQLAVRRSQAMAEQKSVAASDVVIAPPDTGRPVDINLEQPRVAIDSAFDTWP